MKAEDLVEVLLNAMQEVLSAHANDDHRPRAFYIASEALQKFHSAKLEAALPLQPVAKVCEGGCLYATKFNAPVSLPQQEGEASKNDARYRWLREHAYIELECDSPRLPGWTNERFDAAVDASMSKEKGTPHA